MPHPAPRSSFTASSPGYLAFIPGGGIYPAALADFIADTTNRYTGVWQAAPALVQLEANALDWLRDWMEFPSEARGLFTSGGSMATFNAIVCARERYLGAEIRRGVLYTSDQAHHSVVKSAKLAGNPQPCGSISPVRMISAGPSSADNMPPAPNNPQKNGAFERFMAAASRRRRR